MVLNNNGRKILHSVQAVCTQSSFTIPWPQPCDTQSQDNKSMSAELQVMLLCNQKAKMKSKSNPSGDILT